MLPAVRANDAPPPPAAPGRRPRPAIRPRPSPRPAPARTALARADLAAYRGWIRFLRYDAETAVARHGTASKEAAEKIQPA